MFKGKNKSFLIFLKSQYQFQYQLPGNYSVREFESDLWYGYLGSYEHSVEWLHHDGEGFCSGMNRLPCISYSIALSITKHMSVSKKHIEEQ